MTDSSAELQTLRWRVARLERLLISAYALIVAAVLLVGLCVPFMIADVGTDDEQGTSVLAVVAAIFTQSWQVAGDSDVALGIMMIIGFSGLALLTLLTIGAVLISAARGTLAGRSRVFLRVMVILGIIGALVPLIFGAMAEGNNENGGFAPGGLILLAGMLAVLPLFSGGARPLADTKSH